MSPRIALCGAVLGLATAAYLGFVLLPMLSGGQDPFPACSSTNKYYQFSTKGAVEPVDRFLCMVLPFFVEATKGPFAAWNWAEMLLTLVPIGIHSLEASTTALRSFWVLLVPFVVAALGQVMGVSVSMPLIGIPFYALSGASQLGRRETSVPMAWGIIFCSLLFLVPLTLFFVFPHASTLWLYNATVFQFLPPLMFLTPLPLALCCRNPGKKRRNWAKAHTLLLGLYGAAFGACLLGHVLSSLSLAQDCDWSLATFEALAAEAWANVRVRFLLVDHGVCILAVFLLLILDGGISGLIMVLLLSPFVSIGGAVSLFYARPHQLWFMAKDTAQDKQE